MVSGDPLDRATAMLFFDDSDLAYWLQHKLVAPVEVLMCHGQLSFHCGGLLLFFSNTNSQGRYRPTC
jgi:hypothetical protein